MLLKGAINQFLSVRKAEKAIIITLQITAQPYVFLKIVVPILPSCLEKTFYCLGLHLL